MFNYFTAFVLLLSTFYFLKGFHNESGINLSKKPSSMSSTAGSSSYQIHSPLCFIIMGVSGSGKSTIGKKLSSIFNITFIDGDALHPQSNIIKMTNNQPLNDDDRKPWLNNINQIIFEHNKINKNLIIVCSALKKKYRNIIRQNTNVKFIYLKGDYDTILERIKLRKNHFMNENLLKSQFETLEEPIQENDIITIDVHSNIDIVLQKCIEAIKKYI